MNSLRLFISLTLLNLTFVAAAAASEAEVNRSIARAATKFAQSHSSVGSFRVEVERVAGDYARARAWPTRRAVTDPVWIFLKNDRGKWRGLVLGTAFTAHDYRRLGIPRELRVK